MYLLEDSYIGRKQLNDKHSHVTETCLRKFVDFSLTTR